MQPISIFPQTIKSARLVLRVLPPTKENATILLDIINKNRDYFMDWQAHFGELKTVDDVVAYLTKRENQIKTNSGVCFYIFHNDNIIGRIRFFGIQDNACEIG